MTNKQVALIGLGPLAASIGLALKNAKPELTIVGTDRDGGLATRMQKLGAIDRVERRPASASKDAALVIISEPLTDMPAMLESVAETVAPGAVVTDTAPLKVDVLNWAKQFLPDTVAFVGGHPLLAGPISEQPRPDLLVGVEYCLVPGANATEAAVDLLSGLIAAVGAQPYFLDAAEHDGLMAAVDGLPLALQLAFMAAVSNAGSWRDNQRAASAPFNHATCLLDNDPAVNAFMLGANRHNIAHWIEVFEQALAQIKTALLAEDREAFGQQIAKLHDTRLKWMHDHQQRSWDTSAPQVEVDKRNIFARLLLPEMRRPEPKKPT
jgi:prephenate dehydrogenase